MNRKPMERIDFKRLDVAGEHSILGGYNGLPGSEELSENGPPSGEEATSLPLSPPPPRPPESKKKD